MLGQQLKKENYHLFVFSIVKKRLWSSFSLKKCRWLVPCERVVLIYRKQHTTTFVTCHHGIVAVQQWFYYALYIMDCASRVDQIPCLFFLNVPFRHNSPCISSSYVVLEEEGDGGSAGLIYKLSRHNQISLNSCMHAQLSGKNRHQHRSWVSPPSWIIYGLSLSTHTLCKILLHLKCILTSAPTTKPIIQYQKRGVKWDGRRGYITPFVRRFRIIHTLLY